MEITRVGTHPSASGDPDWFTGSVRIDPDVVRIGPGERHWHGASPTTGMSHVAITEMLDGRSVEWLEPVTDAQYAPSEGASA